MIEPFLSAAEVLKKLEDAGFEAFFVGGAVRDFLLKKPIHDVDIATSATPAEIKQAFSKTIDIGIEHGTILVLYKDNSYEITTFRAESEYVDFRRPKEVKFIRSLTKDLERRDFTINAMAMDRNGKLHDPFKGQAGIKAKEIKTVGSAEDRFREDALRMMRAVRFVSQLSFEIEAETLKALTELGYLLEKIAVERKRAEFEKLIGGENRKQAIKLILETNLFSYLPGLKNRKAQLNQLLSYSCEDLTADEMWSLLCYTFGISGKEAELFLRDWRLPVKQIKEIQAILSFLANRVEYGWSKYQLYLAQPRVFLSVEKLYQVITNKHNAASIQSLLELYQGLPIKKRADLHVTGSDLLGWYSKKGGPWIQESLCKIEHAVLEGMVENKKTIIKEWLLECNQK